MGRRFFHRFLDTADRIADLYLCLVNAVTVQVDFQVSGYPTRHNARRTRRLT